MRIVVTGAGLIGAHTAAELIRAGHHVVLLDVRPDRRYLAAVVGSSPPSRRVDVRDVAGVRAALTEHRAEAVVHTVGLLGAKADRHPYLAFQVNAAAAAAVAEAARLCGLRQLVQLSSLAVYDWPAAAGMSTVDESFATAPRNAYAASKLAGEFAVRCYAASGWLDVTVLRLAGVYGPGLFTGGAVVGGLLQRTVVRALAGRPVTVPARLSGHEYLYAADVAAAVRLILERRLNGVYNVGTGRTYSAADIADALRLIAPGTAVEAAADAGATAVLDCRRLRRDVPEWTCRTLDEGLANLASTLDEHPWLGGAADSADHPGPAAPHLVASGAAVAEAKERQR